MNRGTVFAINVMGVCLVGLAFGLVIAVGERIVEMGIMAIVGLIIAKIGSLFCGGRGVSGFIGNVIGVPVVCFGLLCVVAVPVGGIVAAMTT